ncbi:MAG: hypothetical protein J0M24_15520 [Verrucomicrobia bacterium]|nr:hypothetical protein [Verrucomicrobiota bacterium]
MKFKDSHRPEGEPEKPNLSVQPGTPPKLSKAQRDFQRLTQKIEKLRAKLERKTEEFREAMRFLGTELHPLDLQVADRTKQTIRLVFPFMSETKRGHDWEQKVRKCLQIQLLTVVRLEGDLVDGDLKEIFRVVEGKTVEESKKEEEEATRVEIEREIKDLGLDPRVMMSEGLPNADQLKEIMEHLARKFEAGLPPERPKSARQVAKEKARAELRSKDLGSLFKQLAKLLHPDLEQDPVLRVQKEADMKELNQAYETENLHRMLQLEAKWIVREQGNAAHLSGTKLAIYNEVLREQVEELEMDLEDLPDDPRFEPLRMYLDPFTGELELDQAGALQFRREVVWRMDQMIQGLKGPNPLAAVRRLLEDLDDSLPRWRRR